MVETKIPLGSLDQLSLMPLALIWQWLKQNDSSLVLLLLALKTCRETDSILMFLCNKNNTMSVWLPGEDMSYNGFSLLVFLSDPFKSNVCWQDHLSIWVNHTQQLY